MPTRRLGRTGLTVSAIGLGGHHIGRPKDEALGIRLIHMAVDHGITFMDNCWDYHDGESERRMGKALRDGGRNKVVLMTKIDGQTKVAAMAQIEESLKRLQTDRIDLLQLHEIIRPTDPDRIFGPNGAIEAVMQAKQQGKIRFVGFTGHKDPSIHLKMLDVAKAHGFRFDTVQMPLNVMDAHYRSFGKLVLPRLVAEDIGVLGMKPMGDGSIPKSGIVTANECLQYSLNLPTSVVITGCEEIPVLEQALRAAFTFRRLPQPEVDKLLARTARAGAEGSYEKFKNSPKFDGTIAHPEWLG